MEIELDGVRKCFGTTVALDGVELSVEEGTRAGLVGPNGSGKTTLIRAITGAVAAEGEVRVDGVDPFERRAEIAERMAYVPQIAPEFSVRVGRLTETVCRAREIEPARVAEVTERLDFALDRHRDKPYRDLSGGMKQKVSIGLALAGDPDLLVMDEPTASLDAPTRSSFFAACAELDGPTLVLCSHRIAEIRHLVDTIVELESGRVDDVRSVGEFVDASGRAVLECQFREGAEPPADLLNRLGLESVGDGVWSGVLDWREKVPTVRKLIDTHGDALEDLVVEDVTRIGHEKAG